MKLIYTFLFIIVIFASCVPDPILEDAGGREIGMLDVDLELSEDITRVREAPVGNLITDSVMYFVNKNLKEDVREFFKKESNSFEVDFAIINSGSIRPLSELYEDEIIPQGPFTIGTLNQLLPFRNYIYIVEISGAELKSIFEHSVAKIANKAGQFLHVSKSVVLTYDKSKVPELLSNDNEEIIKEGERVISIKINGVEIDNLTKYYVAMSGYLAVDNGDKFLTLDNIDKSLKMKTEVTFKNAVEVYFSENNLINPSVEGRIIDLDSL